MCRRWSYQREFWARTTAGIISASAAALFIKPTSAEEKSSKQNALFIAQRVNLCRRIQSTFFIAVRKFFICTCWQECQKISKAIIKEEIKPVFPAAGPTLYKRPAGDVRHLHSLCIGTSVWLSENCRNKDEILNQGGLFFPFLFCEEHRSR